AQDPVNGRTAEREDGEREGRWAGPADGESETRRTRVEHETSGERRPGAVRVPCVCRGDSGRPLRHAGTVGRPGGAGAARSIAEAGGEGRRAGPGGARPSSADQREPSSGATRRWTRGEVS